MRETLDHFLVERYFLYTYAKNHLLQGQVHHTPYPIQTAEIHELQETLLAAATLTRPEMSPIVHFSSGVDVEIFPLRKVVKSSY